MDAEQEFQAAAQLFQSGDFSGAETRLESLNQSIPGNPNILHLLSLARLRQDKAAAAVESLKMLTDTVPDSAEARDLLGCALRQAGRINAAIREFRKALSIAPDAANIHYNLGNAYRDDRQVGPAVTHYKRATELDPDNLNAHFNLGEIYYKALDMTLAAESLHVVALRDPQDLMTQRLLASAAFQAKLFALARTACDNALALAPGNEELLVLRSLCAAQLADYPAAVAAYDELLALRPGDAALLRAKAAALRAMGDAEGALEQYRQARDAAPDDAINQAQLGAMLERLNRADEAWAAISPGLAAEPGHPSLNLVAARLEHRSGEDGKALSRLAGLDEKDLDASPARGDIHFEMADHYDRLGRPGDAIENYEQANAFLARDSEAVEMFRARSAEYLRRLKSAYDDPAALPAAPAARSGQGASPVFIVGFPRSGAAQVERLLDDRPGFRVLTGTSALSAVRDRLLARGDGFPANLFTLSEEDLASLRAFYFETFDRLLPGGDPLARPVDSMGLNILDAGLIHRLFPDARFVHALRHPCDACLECFMHPFRLDLGTVHFTRLDDTVRFFDEVMALWQVQRDALGLAVHDFRLEGFADDPDGALRGLLTFLESAESDAPPSRIAQADDGITLAPGGWRKYEIHMAPHLQRLRPYLKTFGAGNGS